MSHRTAHLPENTSAVRRFLEEIRYHEASRQLLALLYVAIVAIFGYATPLTFYLALPLILLGIAVRLWASGYIMKNKQLATDGPYGMVRHPLYTGNVLILVGFCIATQLWWGYVLLAVLLALFYPATIRYEDSKLHKIFGEEWQDWSSKTPALFPRRFDFASENKWSFTKSLRKNGEPLIIAYLIIWLWVLFEKFA